MSCYYASLVGVYKRLKGISLADVAAWKWVYGLVRHLNLFYSVAPMF